MRLWAGWLALFLGVAPLVNARSPGLVDNDFNDKQAVLEVCSGCHANTAFLDTPRSWQRWNDVFAQMVSRGATGTDEQLARVTRYFLENLTIVNVNTSPADEVGPVLGLSEQGAAALLERRARRPFKNAADIERFPGIDKDRLKRLSGRLLF